MDFTKFLNYLAVERNYSVHTITAYETDLNQFGNFLSEQYQITAFETINRAMLRSWVVSLMEQKQNATTVSRKVSAVKSYFKYLRRIGALKQNPSGNLILPKKAKRLPEFVDKTALNQLLDKEYTQGSFEEQRNSLIVEMFYFTGMRLSELISIKIKDIDCYNLQIKVLGKRNKERLIPLTLSFSKSLEAYLLLPVMTDSSPDDYLFVSIDKKKLYPKLVYTIVKTYLSTVAHQGKKSPHVLRHSFATHMLNNGADINAIKTLLGHESLAATQVYTHNTIEKLKNIHKQAHPRG